MSARRCGRATIWYCSGMDLNASDIADSCWLRKLEELGTSDSATLSRMRLTSLSRYLTPVASSTAGTLSKTSRSLTGGLPRISTVSCFPVMSSMTSDISSSPTLVRLIWKLDFSPASDMVACSSWVVSCTPDVAVPSRPLNALVTPDTRSMPARESCSILYCCSVSWKSRSTLNTAPGWAMWSASRRMSASTREAWARNCSSVSATAPLVLVVRVADRPQRILDVAELTLSCRYIMGLTSP